jgi:hypothetical protein
MELAFLSLKLEMAPEEASQTGFFGTIASVPSLMSLAALETISPRL